MKRILVLFPNDWDKIEFAKIKYTNRYIFLFEGPNLFEFPHYFKLPFFSVSNFITRVLKKARKEKVDAVLSTDEYLGAIIASIIAKELGLSHSDPSKIILAQHKYYSRLTQNTCQPETSVNCDLIDQKIDSDFESSLPFPCFVKPVKGTFSLFAKKVSSTNDLKNHMNFNWFEKIVFNSITRPFNHLLRNYSNLEKNADYFIAEELIEGLQVTVDGFVYKNKVTICGIVDSIMFPGTNIFERFEYPSKLSKSVQERMNKVVEKIIKCIGFSNSQFNVELFYSEDKDQIRIIEINPRLSYQFGDLYENIDGTNTYQVLIDLALGKKPEFVKEKGAFKNTASFVLRTFQGKRLHSIPENKQIEEFKSRYPECNIKVYGKKGTKLSKEMRAIGSYRYGIVNIGAHSPLDLFGIYEDIIESLPFTFK